MALQRPATQTSMGKQIPTDGLLQQIADRAHRRDWHLLANKLHFTSSDISSFQNKHPRDAKEQVFAEIYIIN